MVNSATYPSGTLFRGGPPAAARNAAPACCAPETPIAAHLAYALDWTADTARGSARDALAALCRGLSNLLAELDMDDDPVKWTLVARALEQRCMLSAFAEDWTRAARQAIRNGDATRVPHITGDHRLVRGTALAAEAALDFLAARSDIPETARPAHDAARARLTRIAALAHDPATRRSKLVVVEGGRKDVPCAFGGGRSNLGPPQALRSGWL